MYFFTDPHAMTEITFLLDRLRAYKNAGSTDNIDGYRLLWTIDILSQLLMSVLIKQVITNYQMHTSIYIVILLAWLDAVALIRLYFNCNIRPMQKMTNPH